MGGESDSSFSDLLPNLFICASPIQILITPGQNPDDLHEDCGARL